MRFGLICSTVLMLLCSAGLQAKNLCGVRISGVDNKKASFSISNTSDLTILSRADAGDKSAMQYSLKAGRLEQDGKPVEALSAEYGSTVYVAEGNVRGCVIKAEERDGRKVLYVEELFHAPKRAPRIETQFIELE